jgi:mRNA interferase RelE/StbE
MSFIVKFKDSAEKDFESLEIKNKWRVRRAIDSLSDNPFPPSVKKMKGEIGLFRLRIGNLRLVYFIDFRNKKIVIIKIKHRKDI